jgi:hypothetical protein
MAVFAKQRGTDPETFALHQQPLDLVGRGAPPHRPGACMPYTGTRIRTRTSPHMAPQARLHSGRTRARP